MQEYPNKTMANSTDEIAVTDMGMNPPVIEYEVMSEVKKELEDLFITQETPAMTIDCNGELLKKPKEIEVMIREESHMMSFDEEYVRSTESTHQKEGLLFPDNEYLH